MLAEWLAKEQEDEHRQGILHGVATSGHRCVQCMVRPTVDDWRRAGVVIGVLHDAHAAGLHVTRIRLTADEVNDLERVTGQRKLFLGKVVRPL